MRTWSIIISFALGACQSWFSVPRAQLPAIAAQLADQGVVAVQDGDRTLRVTPSDNPVVRINFVHCVHSHKKCADDLERPLDQVTADGTFGFPADNIASTELSYDGYHPKAWHPKFAVGVLVGGAAAALAGVVEVFPINELAIELGGGSIDDKSVDAFAGIRVRVGQVQDWRPFVGAFANVYSRAQTTTAAGGRFGLERAIYRDQLLFTIELDPSYAISNPDTYSALAVSRHVFFTGGLGLAYQF